MAVECDLPNSELAGFSGDRSPDGSGRLAFRAGSGPTGQVVFPERKDPGSSGLTPRLGTEMNGAGEESGSGTGRVGNVSDYADHAVSHDAISAEDRAMINGDVVLAFDAADDVMAVVDDNFETIYANAACARLLGCVTLDEAVGRDVSGVLDGGSSSYLAKIIAPQLHAKGSWAGEIRCRTMPGEIGYYEASITATGGGKYLIVLRDISARRTTETDRARQWQYLAVLQERAAMRKIIMQFAHDFNNLNAIALSSAHLASKAAEGDATVQSHTKRALEAGKRADELVKQLAENILDHGRSGPFGLKDPLDEAALLFGSVVSHGALNLSFDAEELVVDAAPAEVCEVTLALAKCIQDALPAEARDVSVCVSETVGKAARGQDASLTAGVLEDERRYARIRISGTDTAPNESLLLEMPANLLFDTAGLPGVMGVAAVERLVHEAHIAMRVFSADGPIKLIDVFWPLAEGSAKPEKTAIAAPTADLHGETILVVDDDEAIADILSTILEQAGASVAACIAPEDALSAVTEDPDAWSMMITDFDMDGMTGAELAESCHAIRADLPILACTAVPHVLEHEGTAQQFDAVIGKPFSDLDLLDKVRGILAQRG